MSILKNSKKITSDLTLTKEEEIKKLEELGPPPALVREVKQEITIQDQGDAWTDGAAQLTRIIDNPEELAKSPLVQTDGVFDPKKLEDYKKFIELNDFRNDLNTTARRVSGEENPEFTKLYNKLAEKYGEITKDKNGNDIPPNMRPAYLGQHLDKLQADITDPYDEALDKKFETREGVVSSLDKRIEILKNTEANPGQVLIADTYLPQDFSGIKNKEDLDKQMKASYQDFVKNDKIIQNQWETIQKIAKPKIQAYQNEIQKTADLTTPEGVAAANAKVQAYAKSQTIDVLNNSEAYKQRVVNLGIVMDKAMSNKSTAYERSQNKFLAGLDSFRGGESDFIPFNDTLANLIEGVSKGSINLYTSGQKALASIEAKGVRQTQRQIDAIDKKVEDGEISKEEGERLKNFKEGSQSGLEGLPSIMEELMSDKEDVEKLFDSIQENEKLTSLFKSADLSDGISFQDAILTTAEALPQIGLAALGTMSSNPIVAGLGTAAMFTQMYGDNYWSAYQEGIKKDAKALGIDLNSMSPEDRRDFEINSLNEGKHANMATSAAFAAVMTAAEQFGAKKIFKKTEEALGLGKGGLVSFYKGSWKEGGESLLRGAINKFEAGSTEFATEFAQEVLGQVSTGIQSGNAIDDFIDWGASLEAGKAGGVVGVMIPFGGSVATQSAVEIRNISRDVAIKFAPNSEYGKFSLETKKYFEDAQTNLDNKLKNNELTKEQHEEESTNLADTRNSSLKIAANTDQQNRAIQLDLMVKRNQLQRKIKKINDTDLTQAEQAELEIIQQELQDVVTEQRLYSTNRNVRQMIIDAGPKDSEGNPMIEFRDFSTAKETQEEADRLEKLGYQRAAASKSHGVEMVNETTGKEVLLINNEVASGRGVNEQGQRLIGNVNVAAHEFLHSLLRKTLVNNPRLAKEMRENMDTYLESINVENMDPDSKYAKTLALYKNDKDSVTNEEAMTLFADALANGDIQLNESALTKFENVIRRIMQSLGIRNVKFETGQDVVNFLKDYNNSVRKGGLNKAQKKLLGTEESMKKDGATAKESRARATVLDAINELVPQDITTKAEYDAFLADPRANKPLFDALLLEGGVINNYVRSRTTTKAESDKAIESLTDRIMNFNPEAKRADGKPVGMQGFGEAIFANTRFAKLDAKKALFQEGEKAKQQKSIDGGTLQIADESTTSKKDDTKLAKKPSETTAFDKDTEARIDEAVSKNFKGPDVKFSETRDVPNDVAVIYAEKLGINPQTITDKTKNYTKKDAEGLTKAKQLLLKNAKDDYARLPKLKDDFGKGTFVPKNVKDALYTDGELTGSLKDYMDLIREKPTKPIYRDRVGQTIRGLLNLAIRNRIIETAQPSQGKRLQGGTMFSLALVEPSIKDYMSDKGLTMFAIKGQKFLHDEFTDEQIKSRNESVLLTIPEFGLDFYESINPKTRKTRSSDSFGASSGRTIFNFSNANNINELKDLLDAPLTGEFIKANPKYVEKYTKTVGNDIFLDKAKLKKGSALSTKDITVLKKAESEQGSYAVLTPEQRKEKLKDPDFRARQKEKSKILKKILNVISKNVRTDGKIITGRMEFWASWINSQVNNSKHVMRVLAPIEFFSLSKMPKRTRVEGFKEVDGVVVSGNPLNYVAEHLMPANNTAKISVDLIYNNTVNEDFSIIKDNYVQGQLLKTDDNDVNDKNIGEGSFKSQFPSEFWDMDKPNVWIRYLLGNPNIDLNSYIIYKDGKIMTIAESLGLPLLDSQITPNSISLQNKLILEILGLYKNKDGSYRITTPRSVKSAKAKMNVYINSINTPKAKQSKALTKQYTPKLPENVTTEKKVEILNDYDTTSKLSRALNTPKKGISVFDFDDTLAKTKEKVIVNKADGTTIEISAAKFAEQASELQENGATFNFDNFENVGKGTQKGPLADLALRRQGKFGSKDIFVLTARPQIAATDIKTFLDGIGLNLPLENITGLEDGSPQAKATWVISKTAEGYNDFYFADDAIKNVKAVKEILDQVDIKSDVQLAKASKALTFDKIINNILEDSTGIKSEAEFSKARAQTVGAKKNKFTFFNTPSAEDFVGLIYKFLGKGKVGDAQFQFFQDNLIDPYNRAELAVTRAKITAANDFKALKKSLKTLPKSLSKLTGIGGFTFGQAARVAVWTRQGMEVPGLSKRDAKELNAFIDNNAELDVFVDELINIQKGKPYPAPSQTWLAGNITSDIVNEINKVNRKEYMQEFNENVDIIFSDKVMNKLEAAYGSKYVEALRDTLRRMKSGSNRPVGSSRVVDELLNWLNNSVGAIMFLNTRSAVLQTISAVNFINFGNNNLIAAGRALLNQKQYWKDFMTLMNSPYLVERRDGLKINVSESEIADAVSESSNKPKAFLNLLLSKGFVLTRIADSFAIAAGGATFYRNQIKAYIKSGMDQKAAEKKAFDDFYAVAETSQQSSNPSKISQQQASGAGRVILAFANTPMQYARIIKRATQDLVNGRGDWKTNVSKIVYYSAIQNLIFNALSNALFALAFGEEDEEQEDKTGRIANGMADSLLRGLGIRGAAVAAIKDALITVYEQENKEKGAPELRKAVADLFGFSPPIDSKVRKLTSGLNTLSWEREKMSQEGFNLNNPAYLAFAQILAGLTNVPLDRAITKINNLRAATSDSSAKWQKVALLMGWSAWDLGLPYYGVEDKVEMTPQMILKQKVDVMKKETNTKEQKETLLKLGLTKKQIKALKYEDARVKKIIELQNK